MTEQQFREKAETAPSKENTDFISQVNIKPFRIRQDKDYYYVLMLGTNEYLRSTTPDSVISLAQDMINNCKLEKIVLHKVKGSGDNIFFSDKRELLKGYPSLDHIRLLEGEQYDKMWEIRKKYKSATALPNGNYLSTKKGNQVRFRLGAFSGFTECTGEHITDGVVFHEGKIHLPYERDKFGTISSAESLKRFVQALAVINWKNAKAMMLLDKRKIRNELVRLKTLAEQGEVGTMDADIETEIEVAMYGEETRIRASVLNTSIRQLDQMVGVRRFKEDIQEMMTIRKAGRKLSALGIQSSTQSHHSLLLGPAGTGKTEIARLYTSILYGLGAIPENKMTEVSKEDLVGQYIGDTEKNTQQLLENAIGGVLFVDEAYTLTRKIGSNNSDFGQIALDIIMRYMENHRGKLVVVFAGYEKEINEMLSTNEGLFSRIDHRFHFDNYSLEELTDIFVSMVKKSGYQLKDSETTIARVIQKDMKNGVLAGNARTVRGYVNQLARLQQVAIANNQTDDPGNINEATVRQLIANEPTRDDAMMVRMQERSLAELNEMVGLAELKQQIKTWANRAKVAKKQADLGMQTEKNSLHMAFKGAPGTGKTTVARIVGELLKSNGLLSRGHFKEVSRADLVGTYQGHTAEKSQKLFEEMMGGVLFIDEAYALVQGENDSFGREAVDILIAEMENRRNDLVVILAGYSNEIDKLFESNPGFTSRVPNQFFFPDYSATELYELLEIQLTKQGLTLSEVGRNKLVEYIETQHQLLRVDGNGRWVRNLTEKLKSNQANRLAETDDFSEESLRTITETDVPSAS